MNYRDVDGPLRHLLPYSSDPDVRLDEEIADAWWMLRVAEQRERQTAAKAAKSAVAAERAAERRDRLKRNLAVFSRGPKAVEEP